MSDIADNLRTKAEAGADDKREAGSKPTTGGGGYGARAGQIIRGNLARGGDGKFTSAGNASAKKPAAPTTGRRATDLGKGKTPPKGRAAKPRKGSDPAKAAERDQRRREAAARRAQREADRKRREQERQQAKLDRAVAADAKRRDQLAKREQRQVDQQKRAAERAARRTQREAERRLRQQQPKGGGGGKGGGSKKPDKAAANGNRATVGRTLGVDTDALAALADGTQPTGAAAATMERAGLISKQRDGSYATTAAGRAFLNAAEAGNERQARAMLARAQDQQAARDERRARTEARAGTTPSGRRAKAGASLTVFKDAAGRFRWLAVSSTAFQDRDGEIVSVKALEDDVARSDATGQYGPLRFWHVPGFDIGDCDFRAVSGRSLIEAGTFRRPAYATAIKDGDQVSIGFLHPAGQPDAEGVFTTIATFERSIVPAGRASNPFTRLTVKEADVLTDAKRKEAEARFGPEIVAAILDEAATTEKAADAAGVRHKSTDQLQVGAVGIWDGTQFVVAPTNAAEKAPPPAEEMAMMEDESTADAELAEADTEIEGDDPGPGYVGDMAPDEFMALLTNGLTAALTPLIEALNVETKMRGVVDEIKSLTGAYTAQKDAAAAETAASLKAAQDQVADVDARLKALEGDQPRAAGFRASIAPETEVGDGHRLKGQAPTNQINYLEFLGLGA